MYIRKIHFNVHTKHCRYIYTTAFQTQLNAISLSIFYGSYDMWYILAQVFN